MSNLQWKVIKNEAWRIYTFRDGSEYLIDNPIQLSVQRSYRDGVPIDSHRVISYRADLAEYVSHYVPAGWVGIRWVGDDVSKMAYDF